MKNFDNEKQKCSIYAPISVGELFDKKSILEIKLSKFSGEKLKNIRKELNLLNEIIEKNKIIVDLELFNKLKNINLLLWGIEDEIRFKEELKKFDEEFIKLARSVYFENDKRALVKREINIKSNSTIIEEKSYRDYS